VVGQKHDYRSEFRCKQFGVFLMQGQRHLHITMNQPFAYKSHGLGQAKPELVDGFGLAWGFRSQSCLGPSRAGTPLGGHKYMHTTFFAKAL
jgi:hypothetical protein